MQTSPTDLNFVFSNTQASQPGTFEVAPHQPENLTPLSPLQQLAKDNAAIFPAYTTVGTKQKPQPLHQNHAEAIQPTIEPAPAPAPNFITLQKQQPLESTLTPQNANLGLNPWVNNPEVRGNFVSPLINPVGAIDSSLAQNSPQLVPAHQSQELLSTNNSSNNILQGLRPNQKPVAKLIPRNNIVLTNSNDPHLLQKHLDGLRKSQNKANSK